MFLDLTLRSRFEFFTLVAVVVALERGWNCQPNLPDKRAHLGTEPRTLARWQTKRTWSFRVLEIIDVAPVVRCIFFVGALGREFANGPRTKIL